jgi:hypothetical protein
MLSSAEPFECDRPRLTRALAMTRGVGCFDACEALTRTRTTNPSGFSCSAVSGSPVVSE